MNSIVVVGKCPQRIFGLSPEDRLSRQDCAAHGTVIVASGSAVLGDGTLAWLRSHPGKMLTSPAGVPIAIAVPPAEQASAEAAFSGRRHSYACVSSNDGPSFFNRKLRRRERLFAFNLDERPPDEVERLLFDNVYKGVTDLVTKWVWPRPAFWLTRHLARLGVSPNAVTVVGILLVFAAGYWLYQGQIALGLGAAWLMTFLDTVDGKLARVTARSSQLGNLLDHGTDLIHPPFWWLCLAFGIVANDPMSASMVSPACWTIVLSYLAGRAIEQLFKYRLGFNQYIWRPFDSAFRLIVARRNSLLLIVTVGLLVDQLVMSFLVTAAWSVLSTLIQIVRFGQATVARPIQSWLQQDA